MRVRGAPSTAVPLARVPRNPPGVKGMGEGGAISPPAAIANAVVDALAPLRVRLTATPVTAPRLYALITAARG